MSNYTAEAKKGKIVYLKENIMEIGLNHNSGFTTLRLNIHDMPTELREKVLANDEDIMILLEEYLDDYYSGAELESVTLIRGEDCESPHQWKDIFSYCGTIRKAVVKARGTMVRLLNCV